MTAKNEGKSYNSEIDYELAARTSELNGQKIEIRILKEKYNNGEISEAVYLKKLSETQKKITQLEQKIADLQIKLGKIAPSTSLDAGKKIKPGKRITRQGAGLSAQAKKTGRASAPLSKATISTPPQHAKSASGKPGKYKSAYGKEKRAPMYKSEFNIFKIIIPVIAVLAVAGIAWLVLSLTSATTAGIDINSRAPDFGGRTVGGKTISLSDYKGKNILLTFWVSSTNCTEEWVITETIAKANVNNNIVPVVIASGNNTAIINCIKNNTISYPVILDSDGTIAARYEVNTYPATFFIDSTSMIKHIRFGSLYSGDGIDAIFNSDSQVAAATNKTPRISDVSILSVSETGAVITWVTDVPADSQVEFKYGKNVQTVSDKNLDTRHSIVLGRLLSATEYQLTIKSKDGDGSVSSLPAYSFRTLKDMTPPVITDAATSGISQTSINLIWNTDEPTAGQIEYGTSSLLGTATPVDTMMVTSHTLAISGLNPGTAYYIRIKSMDAAGNTGIYDLKPVTTHSIITGEIKIGMKAPDFSLLTVDGRKMSLSDFKGKKVMLVFFSTNCRPCMIELPMIQEAYKSFQDWKVNIVAITADQKIDDVRTFINNSKITYPILLDSEGKANEAYLVPLTPYNVFIDGNGIIKNIHEGRYYSQADLLTAMENL